MSVGAHLARAWRAKSARAKNNGTSFTRTRTPSALARAWCALGAQSNATLVPFRSGAD